MGLTCPQLKGAKEEWKPKSAVYTVSIEVETSVYSLVLGLGVNLGVSVDLGGGGDEESGLDSLGQSEHVERSEERGLDRLDSVVLVVRGRGRAGEVVDLYENVRGGKQGWVGVSTRSTDLRMLARRRKERCLLLTVDLDHEGLDDVVSDHLEVGVSNPVGDLERKESSR